MKLRKKHIVFITLVILLLFIIIDIIRIYNYRTIPSLPRKDYKTNIDKIYFDLVNNANKIDWRQLNESLQYIDKQYDCSDFQVNILLRILYDYQQIIPNDTKQKIKNTLLKFRYWMDEPGENSMCYWSENHQILFASSEYLAGQLYPDDIFYNSKMTGKQHMIKAAKRIKDWLEMRWKFGFSEFYSNVYYNEDIAGMINLIDYSKDEEIVKKAEIIMDLLIYDIASQKFDNVFTSVSGRAYERNRKGGLSVSTNRIVDYIWNKTRSTVPHINYGFIASKKYHVPSVLVELGKDNNNVVIKQCNGLNISELRNEGYYGSDDRSIMMQWAMESYVNPDIVRNSISYIKKNNMFSNEFFKDIKPLDFSLIRLFHLEPFLINIINPQYKGTAIQRANTYTYRTKNYSIYSVQNYFPGYYADQVHVAGMNIGNSFSIFHTHPALPASNPNHSPNYWVGYGRLPHVAQDSSISMSIYNLPREKGMLEISMLDFTHAFFPKDKFDSVFIINNYAFGKKGRTYCALIGRNNLYYNKNSKDDLIQQGRKTFWIIEAGSEDQDGSFKNFYNRILNNKVNFDSENLLLSYFSRGKELKLKYGGDFLINGSKIKMEYPRFDSPYIKAKFKPDSLDFRFNNKFLHLDFVKTKREYN